MRAVLMIALIALLAVPMVPSAVAQAPTDKWFVGAGDIADCRASGVAEGARTTRWLLDNIINDRGAGRVAIFTAGDNSYRPGDGVFSVTCYEYLEGSPNTPWTSLKAWSRYKSITYPAPGNHDYQHVHPSGERYHDYFGGTEGIAGVRACGAFDAGAPSTGSPGAPFALSGPEYCAGERGKDWYTFEYSGWRIIVLNSEVLSNPTLKSEQVAWLRAVLQSEPSRVCTLAIWHRPRFTTGAYGDDASVAPFWDALRQYRADVIINAHDHNYQRFSTSMTRPDGTPNPAHSIRQFVVGTGGATLYTAVNPSEAAISRDAQGNPVRLNMHGVLVLRLRSGSYDWYFNYIGWNSVTQRLEAGYADMQFGAQCRI